MEFEQPAFNLSIISPELFLMVVAILLFVTAKIKKEVSESFSISIVLGGLLSTIYLLNLSGFGIGFGQIFFNDPIAVYSKILILLSAFLSCIIFHLQKNRDVLLRSENFYGTILLSSLGGMLAVSALEFMSLYIGLEIAAISFFVLCFFYFKNQNLRDFYVSISMLFASTALILFGLVFLYGLSGTTEFIQMKINIAITHLTFETIGVTIILSIVMILSGLMMKLSIPPFHQWKIKLLKSLPPAYSSHLNTSINIVLLVIFARVFLNALSAFHGEEMAPNDWGWLISIVAATGTLFGAFMLFKEANFKKIVGYLVVSQIGFLLIGMAASSSDGLIGSTFLFFPFLLSICGIYGMLAFTFNEAETETIKISDFDGLGRKAPLTAIGLSIFLLSLSGLPITTGFVGKYSVINAVLATGSDSQGNYIYWVLAGAGVLSSLLTLVFSFRLISRMFKNVESRYTQFELSALSIVFLIITIGGSIFFGIYPDPILSFASDISSSFGFIAD